MNPNSTIDLGEGPSPGTWSLDDREGNRPLLLLSPSGRPAEAIDLREVAGLSGDGYTLELALGDRVVRLAKLGSDGPNLKEALWRMWPDVRAKVLRLDASGEFIRFSGNVDLGDDARRGPGWIMLHEHVILVIFEGGDAEPLFLSDLSDVRLLPEEYAVEGRTWDGRRVVFSRLAAKTEAFAAAVTDNRARLAAEAAEVLAARLPAMPSGDRAHLASRWLPGQVLSLDQLEAAGPGITTCLEAGWFGDVHRAAEARSVRSAYPGAATYLGYTRPGAEPTLSNASLADEDSQAPTTVAQTGEPPAGEVETTGTVHETEAPRTSPETAGPHLWMLIDRGGDGQPRWLLENLSAGDFATYRFTGESELPELVGHLLSAPEFSREALYLPIADLTDERADLAIPARDLGFLRELRARFAGRVIHGDVERWLSDLDT
jgi:hypothetical protein